MNVEFGAEAALFPEKEYINGIFFAVRVGVWGRGRLPAYLYFCFIRKRITFPCRLLAKENLLILKDVHDMGRDLLAK